MRQRPWFIILLGVLHIAAPIGNMMVNAYWANIHPIRYLTLYVQTHNLMTNLPGLFLPIGAGLCILICRKWSFITYFCVMSILCAFDFRAYQERMLEMNGRMLLTILFLNVATMLTVLHPKVSRIYLNPKLRWWESKPRYNCDMPVELESSFGTVKGLAKNFSETGILFDSAKSLPNEEIVHLTIGAGEAALKVEGQVVRHHPAGHNEFGIKFKHNKQSLKHARDIIHQLQILDPKPRENKTSFIDSFTS